LRLSESERRLLLLWRSADQTGRERLRRLVAGALAGRITLSLEEAQMAAPADAEAIADSLPGDLLSDWIGRRRPN
jgi:hypothetical protein